MRTTIKFLLLTGLLHFTTWAHGDEDIPPPPMPEYMKKYQGEHEQPTTANSKLQYQQSPEPKEKAGKFLNKKQANDTVVYRKPEPEESIEDRAPQNDDSATGEDIRHQYLEDVGLESDDHGDEPRESATTDQPATEYEPINEMESAKPLVEKPTMMVEDAPGPEPVAEVDEEEVVVPEFEDAGVVTNEEEDARRQYLQDTGSEIQQEVAEDASEKLQEVEQNLEEAEGMAEQKLAGVTKNSGKSFKGGMYKFKKDCTMHSEPRSLSENRGVIKKGRKLWIDAHNSGWRKAYKKEGTVYISADCL